MTTLTATELREKAAAYESEARAIWERSDTDGFLSEWAMGLSAAKARREADLVEAGGVHEFLALFTTEGEWVPAKVIEGHWGPRWMVLDAEGKRTGKYLPYLPARRSTLAKHGYVEGRASWPAYVTYGGGRGTGISGCTSVRLVVRKKGADHEPPVEILCTDRWAEEVS